MKLSHVTIAVEDMDNMVKFYNAVFDAGLKPAGDHGFHNGRLGDFTLTLCPNTIAGVVAEQNRQQFRFSVDDLDGVIEKVEPGGGELMDVIQEINHMRMASVRDPDGNTIVFAQTMA